MATWCGGALASVHAEFIVTGSMFVCLEYKI